MQNKYLLVAIILIQIFSNINSYDPRTDENEPCAANEYRKYLDFDFDPISNAGIRYFCMDCDKTCKRCVGRFNTDCTACKVEHGRVIQRLQDEINKFVCVCPIGYYEKTNSADPECGKCLSQCASCDNQFSCTECADSRMQMPKCQYPINEHYYIPSSQKTYRCAKKCKTCELVNPGISDQTQCSECQGQNRSDQAPQCLCFKGYHDNHGNFQNCERCIQRFCLACVSNKQCIECDPQSGRILNNFTGQCECPYPGTLEKNGECIEMYQYADTFVEKCPENTTPNEADKFCEIPLREEINNSTMVIAAGVGIIVVQFLLCIIVKSCLQSKFEGFEQKERNKFAEIQKKYDGEEEEEEEQEESENDSDDGKKDREKISQVGSAEEINENIAAEADLFGSINNEQRSNNKLSDEHQDIAIDDRKKQTLGQSDLNPETDADQL